MKRFNILFLCTGNSARSIIGEILASTISDGRLVGFSAGSKPKGFVYQYPKDLAFKLGYPIDKLRSKSWEEFSTIDSPQMDFIITVCDSASKEACPVWPGKPTTMHWSMPDPVAHKSALMVEKTFIHVKNMLEKKILSLLNITFESLSYSEILEKVKKNS